jgi:hypothetical protein
LFDVELFDSKLFNVFRCDRSHSNSALDSGGGVLIAVRCNIHSERIVVPQTDDVEMVLVKLTFESVRVFLCCIYIPSGSLVKVYQNYADALEKSFDEISFNTNDILCFMGDFNLPHINWLYTSNADCDGLAMNLGNALLPTGTGCGSKAELLHTFINYGLYQLSGIKNFQNRILDLVFSNKIEETDISKANTISRMDMYHDPLNIIIPITSEIPPTNTPAQSSGEFNFRKADFPSLSSYIQSIGWSDILESYDDVNDAVDKFYEILIEGFTAFVPMKRGKENDHPPWYSKRLSHLKNRQFNAHRRYKKHGKKTT